MPNDKVYVRTGTSFAANLEVIVISDDEVMIDAGPNSLVIVTRTAEEAVQILQEKRGAQVELPALH